MKRINLSKETKRINFLVNIILNVFENDENMPNIKELVNYKGYLATSLVFDDRPDDYYLMIDFTSKQIEHLHDLDRYTKEIYRNFDDRSEIQNGILSGNEKN